MNTKSFYKLIILSIVCCKFLCFAICVKIRNSDFAPSFQSQMMHLWNNCSNGGRTKMWKFDFGYIPSNGTFSSSCSWTPSVTCRTVSSSVKLVRNHKFSTKSPQQDISGQHYKNMKIVPDTEKLFCNIPEIYAANRTFWHHHVFPMLQVCALQTDR